MEYTIEKNVPMPSGNPGRRRSEATKVFDRMEVGDSIVGTAKDRSSVNQYAKKIGRAVTARQRADGTYRIWRKK